MPANLTLLSPEDCLISKLGEKLAALSNDELSELSLILPTGRLATFLLAKLAKKKTACSAYAPESAIAMGPPMCSSFWRGGHLGFTCDGVPAALWPRDAEE